MCYLFVCLLLATTPFNNAETNLSRMEVAQVLLTVCDTSIFELHTQNVIPSLFYVCVTLQQELSGWS